MDIFERDPRFLETRVSSLYTEYVFDCGYIRVREQFPMPSEVSWECNDSSGAVWLEQCATLVEVSLYNQYILKRAEETFLSDVYLTTLVERLPIKGKYGLLKDTVLDSKIMDLHELKARYYSVTSMDEFNGWMEEFTVFLYTLVLAEPNSFRGTWRHECMMRSLPAGQSSLELAWDYIRRNDVMDGQFLKNRSDLSMEFFFGLLRAGDMDAFRYLTKLLMEEAVQPTHDVCFWFKFGFLRHYSGGRLYHRYVEDEDIQIGLRWEQLGYRVAKLLYGDIIEQPILINGKIPDILPSSPDVIWHKGRVKYAPKFIECKKSELSYFADSLKKYFPYCDELEVWVLETPSREPSPKLQFKRVYGRELADGIRHCDEVLAEEIINLEKDTELYAREWRFLQRYSQIQPNVIDEIMRLYAFLNPYYHSLGVK